MGDSGSGRRWSPAVVLGPGGWGGLGSLWGKVPCSLWSWALRAVAELCSWLSNSVAGSGLCFHSLRGTAVGFWGVWEKAAAGGESCRRGLSEASGPPHPPSSPPCRPRGSQGYSRFPIVTEARKGQTGQKWGNPRLNSSACPAGSDSSRLDPRKSAARSLLPLRKVSLRSTD